MSSGAFSWERFTEAPVVGILRGFSLDEIHHVAAAARDGGLTTIEITMDTPQAAEALRRLTARHAGALNVGAGTVTSMGRLDEALAAGAQFIVTPNCAPAVMERCSALRIPVFPGALSPTEMMAAWEAGAAMIKIFPFEALGLAKLRDLKLELPSIRLMPTGGVDLETIPDLRRAGADAFGVGSPLFHPARVRAGDWEWVKERCRAFREAVNVPQ